MKRTTIAVVEDEADLRELLRHNLAREGYETVGAADGRSGLEMIRRLKPDLVLLDLMLPGADGFEVCRSLKMDADTRGIPIVFLTARDDERDIVLGLELGAEDYVRKPFGWRELLARIRAALRRTHERAIDPEADARRAVEIEGLRIDPARHEVRVEGTPVPFTKTEFGLLLALARSPGRAHPRRSLISSLVGDDVRIQDRNVDVHIRAIRKKLGPAARLIETVRGVGYRFRDEEID